MNRLYWLRVAGVPMLALASMWSPMAVAAGDPVAGRKAFNQCQICHTTEVGGPNRLGPNLAGISGAKAAAKSGFTYSAALKKSGLSWNAKTLDAWLQKPSALVPGNRMIYAGMSDPTTRANMIAYLATLKGK